MLQIVNTRCPVPNPSSALDPFAPPTADLDPRLLPDGAEQPLAGRWTRLGAVWLDGIVLIPSLIIGGVITFLMKKDAWTPETFKSPEQALSISFVFLLCCIPVLAYQWYLMSTTGQSLGKRWTKIKIVKKDGRPVNFVSAVLLRSWVPTIVGWMFMGVGLKAFSNLYGLVDALAIFSAQRRTLHDLIAGTKVVTLERL
jgi:uncharacterized RDD family membrane protein YckC